MAYDVFASETAGRFHAQRFIPSLDIWVDASNLNPANPPGVMTTTQGNPNLVREMGAATMLPDGRAMIWGGNGQTAFYNPATDTWSRGPDMPVVNINGVARQFGATDNPLANLPNGKILTALSPNVPLFSNPTRLFEFDPTNNTFTDVTPPPFGALTFNNFNNNNASIFSMLMLPTGQVMVVSLNTDATSIFGGPTLIYTPDGGPCNEWRPTIRSIVDNRDGTFTLTGTQLNGITEGAMYGEDAQMSTNYPILRMNDRSGNVVYARTFDWSSTGIQTGNRLVSTKFTLPAGTRLTDFTNYTVVASGIASLPFQFFPTAPQQISGVKVQRPRWRRNPRRWRARHSQDRRLCRSQQRRQDQHRRAVRDDRQFRPLHDQ